MTTITDIETQIGFPPNSGHILHEDEILGSAIKQDFVRQWLQKQGIPYKAAKSAMSTSLTKAYCNSRYLTTWRNRVNPNWALLMGEVYEANAFLDDEASTVSSPMPPPKPAEATLPTAPTSAQTEAWLRDLYVQINKTVNSLVDDKIARTTLKLDDSAKQQIKDLARTSAKDRMDELATPRVIEIHNHVTGTTTTIGLQHERFPILLRACQARDHRGFRLNIWLTGPTGSGKTTAAENAAKAMSLDFGSDGSLDADYKVLGFRDANGNIISTQFLDIYEKGGIYVADEIDNWLPSALLSLNAALANGWCSSPRGLIQRHPDCCVIACANTWGLGATSDYVGRTRLDAASLDRFQPKIDWAYDEKLERALAENAMGAEGLSWHDVIVAARRKVQSQGLKIIVSPRATFNGIALLKAGFDAVEALQMTVAAGLSPEQQKAIGVDAQPKPVNHSQGIQNTLEYLVASGKKLEAIKFYRETYGCDLLTAKVAVEKMENVA